MASMMLRSAKTALSRAQIHRRGFPLETGLARQFIAPAASAVGKSPSELSSPVPNPAAIARSEAFAKGFSTAAGTTLRPLSPHLTIFKPQLNSTVSISNRISAAMLVAVALSSYLLFIKVGGVCLTYPSFYQTFFYASKYIAPITTEVTALALAFHLFYGVRHLIKK